MRQANALPRDEGALPTEALLAHVLVSKFADHLPLYRKRCLEPTSRSGLTDEISGRSC